MTKFSATYASALYDLADEEQALDRILSDLSEASKLFKEYPDYIRLLQEPSILKEERKHLLDEAFGNSLHLYSLNFLKILCDKGKLDLLPECEQVFRSRFNDAHNITEVKITSACDLSAEELAKLKTMLESKTGKTVILKSETDASLLGGIKLFMNGKEYDGTVRYRLNEVQALLRGSFLSEQS